MNCFYNVSEKNIRKSVGRKKHVFVGIFVRYNSHVYNF